ncbi:MAG: class I SAM-dependent RNA methyltransferase [Desulfobacterota bacterium]|jgi:putative N6-adenine-specific DNA methylase|nr:class I SAM-dependent RNA methyltransferase [Thermodesulfobacteriota bacterium]
MKAEPLLDFYAICTPGLEPFTTLELPRLGFKEGPLFHPAKLPALRDEVQESSGGVGFRGTLADLYRANLQLRTANRVLVRFGSFKAASFPELRHEAARLPWERFLPPGRPVGLRVACHKSRLYHQGAVAERVVAALGDRLGTPPPVRKTAAEEGAGPQLIFVRLLENHCQISLDSSGPLLHRRGYRQATAKAPLRETLAAGMLLASGWDGLAPLLDPFCGSGTIAIEGALLASGMAPGRHRYFSFMDWSTFDPKLWKQLVAEADRAVRSRGPLIQASDRDRGAVQAARENAERAGVLDRIEFSCRAVSAVEPPPGPGWVVTNPPFGLRVSQGQDLRNLYATLGKVLKTKCPDWQAVLLSPDRRLPGQTGLRLVERASFETGGLAVKLWHGRVPERRP